jgi:hypothetical protein
VTISFPLAWPSGAGGVRRTTLRPVVVVQDSRSPFTGAGQVFAWPGEWWEAEVSLPPMARERAEIWVSWLMSLRGKAGSFLFGPPHAATAQGLATGLPKVNGAGQTGAVLVMDGATASVTGWLKAGDFIQLGAGSSARLHKVLADVATDAGGNATLDIWPSITAAPADNAVITLASPKGLFRLVANDLSHDVDEAALYGLSFGMRSDV